MNHDVCDTEQNSPLYEIQKTSWKELVHLIIFSAFLFLMMSLKHPSPAQT